MNAVEDSETTFILGAPLNEPDQTTFYTPGERGYTDYPTPGQPAHAAA